jgi:hypothetical protein
MGLLVILFVGRFLLFPHRPFMCTSTILEEKEVSSSRQEKILKKKEDFEKRVFPKFMFLPSACQQR